MQRLLRQKEIHQSWKSVGLSTEKIKSPHITLKPEVKHSKEVKQV